MVLAHHVDWDPQLLSQSPWLGPLAPAAARLAQLGDWPRRAALDAMYAEHTRHLTPNEPLRFVENVRKQDRKRAAHIDPEALYDGRIACHREVPTRERDWHDLFNALCFATFPRAKLALHRRQYRALLARLEPGANRLPPTRTREQDTLTLFDEGGIVLVTSPDGRDSLRRASPEALPARAAQLERDGALRQLTFGHALFEHFVEGIVHTRGGARLVVLEELPADAATLVRAVDAALAHSLESPDAFQSPEEHLSLRFDTPEGPVMWAEVAHRDAPRGALQDR